MADAFERRFVIPAPGRTLIAGSYVVEGKEDRRLRYSDVVGADMREGPGVDVVADLEDRADLGTFRHIECLSVLEHSRRPWLMAANLEQMLQPGGTIFVAAPFVWRLHSYPDDYFRFSLSGLKSLFTEIDWIAEGYDVGVAVAKKPLSATIDNMPLLGRCEACLFGTRRRTSILGTVQ